MSLTRDELIDYLEEQVERDKLSEGAALLILEKMRDAE